MSAASSRPASAAPASLALVAWAAASLAIGASGLLAHSPVPPPAIAGAVTLALLVALGCSSAMREHVRALGLRSLVALHLSRIAAGAYFLLLYRRGELPGEFALPAGWGDIAVGVAAITVLMFCFPARSGARRGMLLLWNALGLLDILAVLANGVRLFLRDPALAEPFTRLPLALLPLLVVPVVIVSHVLLFAWGRGAGENE